ncbi:MAG: hypothetical protein H7270_01290 [Dermatophilaceae bacterium]|nr:hypothetical protein [Dermatophilaceae bacterium]
MAELQDGRSPAAWTAVALVLLAAALIAVAVLIKSWPMAIVGITLTVVGAAAGKILAMAGFGQAKSEGSATGTRAR